MTEINIPLRSTYIRIGKSGPFFIGNNTIKYLQKHPNILKGEIMTIVNTSIINIYWKYRELLSLKELENLSFFIKDSLPEFDEDGNLITSLNHYNFMKITVGDFIKFINKKIPIKISLMNLNVIINLTYEDYDFYNYDTNTIDNYI